MLRYFEKSEIVIEKSKQDRINQRIDEAFADIKEYEETDFSECRNINGTPTYIMRALQKNEKVSADLCEEILRIALREIIVTLQDDLIIKNQILTNLGGLYIQRGDYNREIHYCLEELLYTNYDGAYDRVFKDAIMMDLYNYYRATYSRYHISEIPIRKNVENNSESADKRRLCKCIEELSENKKKLLLRGKGISSPYIGDRISVDEENENYLKMECSAWFNEETQLRILLDKKIGDFLNADLAQGKTFLAAKDVYCTLCCEQEASQNDRNEQNVYMDCLLVERITGFNLAMELYEKLLPLIDANNKKHESIMREIIDNILKIHSPVLRIFLIEIIGGYIQQAYLLKVIETPKKALEEINRYLRTYANDVAIVYELGKEVLNEELENRNLITQEEIKEITVPFWKFSLLRRECKDEEERKELEKTLNQDDREELEVYEGIKLLDAKVEKIVYRRRFHLFPSEVEKKIHSSHIWIELASAKKDDYRYKFFAFIMKSIVSKNVIVSEKSR